MAIHPLVRMQRDAMVHAKNVQAGKERAHQNTGFAPEASFDSASPFSSPPWSPELDVLQLGGHASSSGSSYSPALTSRSMSMPPDPFQMGAFQPVSPPHVPSNANYDAYLRQRHNSPQPLLGAVYDDHQTKSIDQRSSMGPASFDYVVPSNALPEWPPHMFNSAAPHWHPSSSQHMGNMTSRSISRASSSSSSFGFEPSPPMGGMNDYLVPPSSFPPEDDTLLQLISDGTYLLPDLMPGPTAHGQVDMPHLAN